MKLLFSFLLSCLLFQWVWGQTPITLGYKYPLESEVLQEGREVWIGLPSNYDSTQAYPVMYVLDAEWQFEIAFALMKELAAYDKIPAHIVVGIPHIDLNHRAKDLTFTPTEFNSAGEPDSVAAAFFNTENTGGGKAFFEYLSQEVVPFVEQHYASNGFDLLIGHSLSGYFGAYVLDQPGPFNAFLLFDPSIWYQQGDAITHLSEKGPKNMDLNVFISTANGGEDRQQYNVDTHRQLYELLEKKKANAVLRVYDDEDHGSVRLPSLNHGLSQLYQGFSFGYIFPTDTVTVEDARRHYQAFSEKVRYRFGCPVEVYRWIGYANFYQQKWEQAIEAYKLCGALYPKDPNLLREFAECHFETKSFNLSLDFYQRALVLDPENDVIKARIQKLEGMVSGDGSH